MNTDLLITALIVGIGTWLMRFLPTRIDTSAITPDGPVSRFLDATGPAAIAALCVASFLPMMEADWSALTMLAAGVAGTFLGFRLRRDISLACVCGAAAYGLAYWLV
ncbi:AzlD domain-containing protein [Pelagibacterium limicola]|uniref:AzlD domain-containing protein n=1 Tax=Pelagibacterium limicola TaxID=2791022 RepID=UPI0018AF90FC|nr:AzlD domain-containing protein [Pelagibacterium limicola]